MKKYCENCQKETQVKFEKIKEVFNVKGESIEAEITICKCMDCGEEVFDEAIEKENEKFVFGLYREKKGLLQPDEIKAIRINANMTQKMFAAYIGVSQKTVEAWESGKNTPAGSSSRILSMLEMNENLIQDYPFVITN